MGFLDDYAFLIRGLLDLYEASLDADWLQWAELLQEQQDRKFWDHEKSGYFTSPEGDLSILIRGKEGDFPRWQFVEVICQKTTAFAEFIHIIAYTHAHALNLSASHCGTLVLLLFVV